MRERCNGRGDHQNRNPPKTAHSSGYQVHCTWSGFPAEMKRDDQHSVRNIPNIRNDKNFSLLIILKNNEIGTLSLDLELTLFMVAALTTWPRCLECRRVCTTPEPPHRCAFFSQGECSVNHQLAGCCNDDGNASGCRSHQARRH